MYPPLLAAALGSLCVGAVATTRVRGSAAGAGWPPCGANDSGALALAFADAGGFRGVAGVVVAVVFAAAGGFAGGGGGGPGTGGAAPARGVPGGGEGFVFCGSVVGGGRLPPGASRRRTGRSHTRHRRRIAVLVQRRKHDARAAGLARPGVDVDRRFLARNDLLGAIAGRHPVRYFGAAVRRRRHDLGRTGIGPDDRRLAAARCSDIGPIGESSAGPHDRQRKTDHHGEHPATTLRPQNFAALPIPLLTLA